MRFIRLISFFILIFNTPMLARTSTEKAKAKQIKVGNFALPAAQQPGPLVSFGQNILDKGDIQLYTQIQYLNGDNKSFTAFTPSILYAITDSLSLFMRLRSVLDARFNNESFNSLENAVIQGEYAIFEKMTRETISMITIVANFTIPLDTPIPHAHLRAPGFFLGFTGSHFDPKWYLFASTGVTIPFGESAAQCLYQAGISRNIAYAPDGWIFNWLVEFDGTYTQHKTVSDSIIKNIGGNSVLLTPSLWFSGKHIVLQGGASWVITQSTSHGINKDDFYIYANLGWLF